jgi:kynureninase
MRVLIVLLAVSVVLHVAVASSPGTLLGSALAVHKRGKAAKKSKAIGDASEGKVRTSPLKNSKKADDSCLPENVAHNTMTKIKVAKSPGKGTTAKDVIRSVEDRERSAAEDKAIAKKQDSFSNGMQMATSVLTMVASRLVFKIDYKNPRTVLLCRLTFCAYVILSQVRYGCGAFHVCCQPTVLVLDCSISFASQATHDVTSRIMHTCCRRCSSGS